MPFADRLYRPRTELPVDAAQRTFGKLNCAVIVTDTDPNCVDAQWMQDRCVALVITDDSPADQLGAALSEFLAFAAELADRPTDASVSLASRAVDHGRVARQHGMWPRSVLAAAELRAGVRHGAGVERSDARVIVRPAVASDADAIAGLWCEQADYEARVGTMRVSPAIKASVAASIPARIEGDGVILVAQVAGEIVAAVVAESAAASSWAGERLTVAPVSYLAMASTTVRARGSGVGSALVGGVHRHHLATGVRVSALHYSAYNPLSIPFWSQHGYRPVVTQFACRVD